ncbi:MAG: VOC family protein [Pseudomonadales bacterium]
MATYAPVITPTVMYQNPLAALDWLERAFGFETITRIVDTEGNTAHLELAFRDAVVGVAGEWESAELLGEARMRSPRSTGGVATQFLWISLPDGIDAHCERARAAGATITQEPADQFYGSRTYRARDPEGHIWCFSEFQREVSEEEMRKSMPGLVFEDPEARS